MKIIAIGLMVVISIVAIALVSACIKNEREGEEK